ncbi:MAG TPA: hypothetical protein VKZ85_04775 [Woeseiaceae bacterium]|nr:hypothetical protein [Woeseiaceae bacterium]
MLDFVDRFFAAVSVMAGDGHVKQRLVQAYEENLQHIDEAFLPPEARERFAELKRRMRAVAPLNGEGPVRATVRKMSGQDAARCGQLMLELLTILVRASAKGDRTKAVKPVEERPPVPAFLVRSNQAG